MGDIPTGHTKPQKEMVRKRTESGMSKATETGVLCNTFIAYVFWNPTYRELQGVAHVPEGMDLPDVNEFLREYTSLGGTRRQQNRRRTRRPGLRGPKRVLEEIVVEPSQSDESHSGEVDVEDQSNKPPQSGASPSNQEIIHMQMRGAEIADDNGPYAVAEDQLWGDSTVGDPQTPLVSAVDHDLRTSEELAMHDGLTEVDAEADVTADWDMMDAPFDDQALLSPYGHSISEDQLYYGFKGSDAASARDIENKRIAWKKLELLLDFRQIIRA